MIQYQKGRMKMKNKLLIILGFITCLFILGGCSYDDDKSTMTAYTSVYPVEFILENLYGNKIAIYSIYPDGNDYKNYNLTNKQLSDYSRGDLYVYSGIIKKEKNYAVKLLNKNKNIKIIDASLGMDYTNDVAETWLNPSNYLMMASNIKKGLQEYVNEHIDIKEIKENYEKLKLNISEIDAELKAVASNANNKTLLVSSDTFKYLEKYGFNVISLEENENLTDKTLSDVRKLLTNKSVSYIFIKDNEEPSKTVTELKEKYNAQVVSLNTISTLNASERKDKKNYISIMMDNINSIKLETNN